MSKNGQPIRALVFDDSDFMRNRISMMLMKCSENGHDAIEQAKRTQPDVVTLGIEMPSMNGFGSI
jgi:chemotaxis response regulator CheB